MADRDRVDREDVESATSAVSEQEKLACFPKVQSIVAGFNTPSKTKIVSSTKATPASTRRHQPNRFAKAIPCMHPASSSSSVNTVGSANGQKILDPVQVYCRVRPDNSEESCIKILDNKSLEISPPDTAPWRMGAKALTYSFEQVFDGETAQQSIFDEIALPLVKDFLQAKNSLLFAYGITGSGKTYTMSGTPNEPGIMPRCLDVIFNSISDVKALKYLFKPDHLNGFDARTKAEAMLDRQREITAANVPKTPGRALRSAKQNYDSDSLFTSKRAYDTTILPVVNKSSVYSVFITYLEIYNNFVYDLLDEAPVDNGTKGKMRMLREDLNHNVYVHGITEVEVQSADEAFEVFNRGQRQRRMAHTILNTESSRSHSIFNIRLVQAPLNEEGEVVDQKSLIGISQLSLVDLAGSERYGRTGATGDRLKEAGNINTSLMTLRKCMDVLRENQRTNSSKIIPYRDTKLTHFLKNYFEGEGRVRMALCVNPRAVDYDENLHVMTFAELTKEVQVARPQPPPPVPREPVTPMPKRKGADVQKPVKRRLIEVNGSEHNIIESIPSAPYRHEMNLGFGVSSTLPIYKMIRSDEDHILSNLRAALQTRISERQKLHGMISTKRETFRARLVGLERSIEYINAEATGLKSKFATVSEEKESLENVFRAFQNEKAELDARIDEQDREIIELKEQLDNCQMENRQREISHMKRQEKLKSDLERERQLDEMRRTRQLHKEEAKLKAEFKDKEKTLAAVRKLVVEGAPSDVARRSRSRRSKRDEVSTSSESDIPSAIEEEHNLRRSARASAAKLHVESPAKHHKSQSQTQIANPIKYRSRSTDNDKWLEHASGVGVCQDTVFQPHMRKKKSVTHLTHPEDITVDTTKYCLKTQQIDAEGDVETVLVKGDVMLTSGGGAQVVFTDAETMKQTSPDRVLSPMRKRQSDASAAARSPSKNRVSGISGYGDGGIGHYSPHKRSRQHN